MDQIKKYPEDYAKPLFILMDYLKKANLVMFNNNMSFCKRNWRYMYVVPLMVGHFIAMTVDIVRVLVDGEDIFADAFMIPIYIVSFQTFIKTILFCFNKHQFEHIIDELGTIWRTDKLNDVQNAMKEASAKELKLSGMVFMRVPLFVAWQYLLLPIIETLIYNIILGEDDQLRLPFRCVYPFEPSSNWLIYGATYIYQIYCMFIVVYTYLGEDFLLITLSSHLSVEFMILREDLIHIKPTEVKGSHTVHDNRGIRKFVKRHQKLIILAQKLDEAINKMMFINLMFTTINLTFFGLAALAATSMTDKLRNILPLVNVLILIFIICHFCEKLKSASEKIFDAATKNAWYDGDLDYQRIILFVIFRSQNPCYLTSMKYVTITLQTFTTVLSTTWSYFSLMHTMYKNSE